jgi:hypothetical protein
MGHRTIRRSSLDCCGISCPWRWAFRCTTPDPSDVVLYSGAATAGYDASQLNPDAAGVGYLLATAASRSG